MRTRRRIHPYVRPELAERLVAYCAAKGITESSFVETALEGRLAGHERDNEVIIRRLDRLSRAVGRTQRDIEVLSEGFAVIVQTWFAVVPERTAEERSVGNRLSSSRFQQFLDIVADRLARGSRLAVAVDAAQTRTDESPTRPNDLGPATGAERD
jgi:hypothetical protein